MDINFDRNSYFFAAIRKLPRSNVSEISDHVKRCLQFTYVDVSFKEFKQNHWTHYWFGRKIIALPAATYSGIVKTIYHLTTAILVTVVPPRDNKNHLQAQCFYIARDLQETFGWLITLLNDSYGQYHVQASGFHKSCYEHFLSAKSDITGNPSNFSYYSYSRNTHQDVVDALNACKSPSDAEKIINNCGHDAKNTLNVGLALVKIAPNLIEKLSYSLRDNSQVVAAALEACKSPVEAEKVISAAGYFARDAFNVGLALVKIAPNLIEKLNYRLRDNSLVVIAALQKCMNTEQAKTVILNSGTTAKNNRGVALELIKIDPLLFKHLGYNAQHDITVVLAAIERSTQSTIAEIWKSISFIARLDIAVIAKMQQKYPKFFVQQAFHDQPNSHFTYGFPNGSNFHFRFTFNNSDTPRQTPPMAVSAPWSEPDDLKNIDTEQANTARRILKAYHRINIKLTEITLAQPQAKQILSELLELPTHTSNENLKKAYRKASLQLHPDRCSLKSGHDAFIVLDTVYKQATL